MAAIKTHQLKEQLFDRGIKAFAVFGFIALLGSLFRISYAGWHPLMFLQTGLYLVVLYLAIYGRRISYSLRAIILSGVAFVLGFGIIIGGGFAIFGLLVLGCFCVLTTIFMGTKAGIVSSVINIIGISIIGICVHAGLIQYKYNPILDLNNISIWITAIFALSMLMGVIVVIIGTLHSQMDVLIHTLQRQNDEIIEKNSLLEKDIAELIRIEQERKTLAGKLQLAQQMETVGKLAGGVAHDLNNILGGIVGYPDLLLAELPQESPLRDTIETIKKSGIKASVIVNDMLTLARRGITTTEVVQLNSIISEYCESPEFKMLKTFHPSVEAAMKLDPKLVNIHGSFFHLSKVLMNLVSNAAEAMPHGGQILISTENRSITNRKVWHEEIKEGEYAVLCVTDTGIGIPDEDIERIFEPFYSKKKMGRSGTGLGMAVVWGSVKDHNGYIEVNSVVGKGTKFTLYFPGTQEPVAPAKQIPSTAEFRGKGESIIVVDDVREQREIASRILQGLGYSVQTFGSGEEALEHLNRAEADLLILDMLMEPGMDGLETYKRISKLHPGQKALIATGFSETEQIKEARKLGVGGYLKKPYLIDDLGLAVKAELEKRSPDKINSFSNKWN
jgi:signal transduction histidine kinase/ActR/RegA family two-component response regulator